MDTVFAAYLSFTNSNSNAFLYRGAFFAIVIDIVDFLPMCFYE